MAPNQSITDPSPKTLPLESDHVPSVGCGLVGTLLDGGATVGGEAGNDANPPPSSVKATVCGWLVSQRRLGGVLFATVQDSTGAVQIALHRDAGSGDEDGGQPGLDTEVLRGVALGSVICVQGHVARRPPDMVNPNMKTGALFGRGGLFAG